MYIPGFLLHLSLLTTFLGVFPTLVPGAQAEFEKEDIYEELKKEEEATDFSKMKTADAEQLRQDFHEKRYLVRAQNDRLLPAVDVSAHHWPVSCHLSWGATKLSARLIPRQYSSRWFVRRSEECGHLPFAWLEAFL